MLGRHWEPAPQLSQCSLWSMPGRFRLVRVQPSSVFRACRVPALVKPGALVAQSLSSSHNLRPDQCLRPHPEEDSLGFAKVGLGRLGPEGASGEKGLWLSHHRPDDNRLVFAESAIDALSYAALHEASQTRYASIGGTPSPKQIALIAAAVATMPPGSEIVSAMDCDRAGRGLSQIIGNAAAQPGSRRVSFRVHSPDREGDDWNDVLEDRSAHSLPAAQRGPSFPKPPEF